MLHVRVSGGDAVERACDRWAACTGKNPVHLFALPGLGHGGSTGDGYANYVFYSSLVHKVAAAPPALKSTELCADWQLDIIDKACAPRVVAAGRSSWQPPEKDLARYTRGREVEMKPVVAMWGLFFHIAHQPFDLDCNAQNEIHQQRENRVLLSIASARPVRLTFLHAACCTQVRELFQPCRWHSVRHRLPEANPKDHGTSRLQAPTQTHRPSLELTAASYIWDDHENGPASHGISDAPAHTAHAGADFLRQSVPHRHEEVQFLEYQGKH